jgi:serine/threonine protein kinase
VVDSAGGQQGDLRGASGPAPRRCHARGFDPAKYPSHSRGRWFVSDFGLALPTGVSTTFFGGTPRYMPPELVYGQRSGRRADVWQLGIVLHEILLGGRPRWSVRAGRPYLQAAIAHPNASERHAAAVVARCLEHNPARRPADASAVAGLLGDIRIRISARKATRTSTPLGSDRPTRVVTGTTITRGQGRARLRNTASGTEAGSRLRRRPLRLPICRNRHTFDQ